MKMLYASKIGKGRPVSDSSGRQEVLAGLLDDGEMVILLLDHHLKQYFIEKVINRFEIDLYRSSNFTTILDDEEWIYYKNFFLKQTVLPEDFIHAV